VPVESSCKGGFYPFNEEHRKLPNLGVLSKLRMLRSKDWLQSPVSRPSSAWLPAAAAGKHCLKAAGISWSPGGSGERKRHPGRRKKPPVQPALKDGGAERDAAAPPRAFRSSRVPAGTVQLLTAINRWGERCLCLLLLPGMNGNYP